MTTNNAPQAHSLTFLAGSNLGVMLSNLAMPINENSSTYEVAMDWLFGRDTGSSSKAIWQQMMRGKVDDDWPPSDALDFCRCCRLLDLIPTWRSRLQEMNRYGVAWMRIVTAWSELEALARQIPDGDGRDEPAIRDALSRRLYDLRNHDYTG